MDFSQPAPPPGITTKKCSKGGCLNRVPIFIDKDQKLCNKCRATNRENQKASRARAAAKAKANPANTTASKKRRASLSADDRPANRPRSNPSDSRGDASEESDDDMCGKSEKEQKADLETFLDAETFYDALREQFKEGTVNFHAAYPVAPDALVSARERVQMVAAEIWKISGHRFTVKDHKKLKTLMVVSIMHYYTNY
ncbi:hypothetical protein C8F04DRAFT_1263796 [Mycena alexandri]|uniref:Uncharacterized protein n=1 Tax=Mycena alexandri TaxID=1745969 RepID=A0AAD6SNK1_9AGAR|nr:hypothetical protein C8F04DRAFT_1263796 [Mycena alexandri]